jgi:hypothetical protein
MPVDLRDESDARGCHGITVILEDASESKVISENARE